MKYENHIEAVEVDKERCIDIAIEECAEMIQALTKYKRGKLNLDNLTEEYVDVEITMEWIAKIFEFDEEAQGSARLLYETNRRFKERRIVDNLNKDNFT